MQPLFVRGFGSGRADVVVERTSTSQCRWQCDSGMLGSWCAFAHICPMFINFLCFIYLYLSIVPHPFSIFFQTGLVWHNLQPEKSDAWWIDVPSRRISDWLPKSLKNGKMMVKLHKSTKSLYGKYGKTWWSTKTMAIMGYIPPFLVGTNGEYRGKFVP